jgi:hypothetical protein
LLSRCNAVAQHAHIVPRTRAAAALHCFESDSQERACKAHVFARHARVVLNMRVHHVASSIRAILERKKTFTRATFLGRLRSRKQGGLECKNKKRSLETF